MRSSKQRSRSKQNRNRSVGNIVNRVFDSSGPEGKVRGTPQQIIEKYNQLARDAQLSGERVATENFQQHAEHYTRMLAEATREQEQRREQQEQQQRDRQQRHNDRGGDRGGNGGGGQPQQDDDAASQPSADQQPAASLDPSEAPQPDVAPKRGKASSGAADVIDTAPDEADTGLVETPESKPAPKRRGRPRKKPADAQPDDAKSEGGKPDKPKAEASSAPEGGPAEAAE